MNGLFMFLFFMSLVVFVVGLLKPSAFARIIKTPTRKKVGLVLGSLSIFLFFAANLTWDTPNDASPTHKTSTILPTQKVKIDVTSQIIKKVDKKYRYFFDIRNNDTKDFEGTVSITLYNDIQNSPLGEDSFSTNKSIEPGLGNSVYIDINTGPVSEHGEYGITKFKYIVETAGKEINDGEGDISKKFENLSL